MNAQIDFLGDQNTKLCKEIEMLEAKLAASEAEAEELKDRLKRIAKKVEKLDRYDPTGDEMRPHRRGDWVEYNDALGAVE